MRAFDRLQPALKLRNLVFLLLLISGIIPLVVTSWVLVSSNRDRLETQEKSFLTRSAKSLSYELDAYSRGQEQFLRQLGTGILAPPGPADAAARLREPWVERYLGRFAFGNPDWVAVRVLDLDGAGPRVSPPELAPGALDALDRAFDEAQGGGHTAYRFAEHLPAAEPMAAVAVPVADEQGARRLVVEAVVRLKLLESVFEREAQEETSAFLVDRAGHLLWSRGADDAARQALERSNLVRDFARRPLNLTSEYSVATPKGDQTMLGQVSPVEASGWGIVVQKPAASVFEDARRMVWSALLSSLLVLFLASLFALFASRWIGQPIQTLSETTHAIAAGNFGERLSGTRWIAEVAGLAADFNRMSGTLAQYVDRIESAARANEELFIGSIRAFTAAVDAKDPYTRGHSERVASISRQVAHHLGQPEEFQKKLWIGALLHDVGKIGIEDRILKKGGVLSPDEFELMKSHPVVGAEILTPIERLKEMLPAVRWHHENWNGKGYPDGLKGEEIPLSARIVAVADCFDAITTSRPYQKAYTPRYAVETITKLAGSRFDAKVVTAFLRAFESGDIALERDETLGGFHPEEAELPAAANT